MNDQEKIEKARRIRDSLKKDYPYYIRSDYDRSDIDTMIDIFALMKAMAKPGDPNYIGLKTVTKKVNKFMFDAATASKPTDIVYMTPPIAQELGKLWGHNDVLNEDGLDVPTDLLLSGTIPVTNIRIDAPIQTYDDQKVKDATIVINHDYKEQLKALRNKETEMTVIGYIHLRFASVNCEVVSELIVDSHSINALCMNSAVALRGNVDPSRISEEGLKYLCTTFLLMWYSIQIALLHPLTKTCIVESNEPISVSTTTSSKPSKKRPHKVKNIRHCYVDMETLNMLKRKPKKPLDGERKYTRRTMVWHVAGYERKGKFIDGHWRGPWRNMKTLAETVERELAVEQNNTD